MELSLSCSASNFCPTGTIVKHELTTQLYSAVMSSESREEVVSQALEAGAAEYLVKPVRRRELTNLWQHVPQQAAGSAPNGHIQGAHHFAWCQGCSFAFRSPQLTSAALRRSAAGASR